MGKCKSHSFQVSSSGATSSSPRECLVSIPLIALPLPPHSSQGRKGGEREKRGEQMERAIGLAVFCFDLHAVSLERPREEVGEPLILSCWIEG